MAKKKIQSAFFCQSCGKQSPKWLGKCPQCNEWNTFVEEITTKENDTKGSFKSNKIYKPTLVSNIDYKNEKRIVTNDNELNRVLGGGIVPGSLILLGGDPGIGKSTLLLQFALSSKSKKYYMFLEKKVKSKLKCEQNVLTETLNIAIF